MRVTDRTMYLYHVTPSRNWYSVGVMGLLSSYAESKQPGVFLVTRERVGWALDHVAARTGTPRDQMIVVKCRVRRSRLVPVRFRTAKRGLWRHTEDVNPCRIEHIKSVLNGEYRDD